MARVLADFPGAKRALFSHFHIGGCQACAYGDEEPLAEVARRNEISAADMIGAILKSHEHDKAFLIEPRDLSSQLKDDASSVLLFDTRTREEFEAVSISGSRLLTQDLQQEMFATPPTNTLVFIDHTGDRAIDTCSWFSGHGVKDVKALRGGIDAWAREIDPTLQRYRLEIS